MTKWTVLILKGKRRMKQKIRGFLFYTSCNKSVGENVEAPFFFLAGGGGSKASKKRGAAGCGGRVQGRGDGGGDFMRGRMRALGSGKRGWRRIYTREGERILREGDPAGFQWIYRWLKERKLVEGWRSNGDGRGRMKEEEEVGMKYANQEWVEPGRGREERFDGRRGPLREIEYEWEKN